MNKQPDFGSDLVALSENVEAEVGDVLQALQQKREASRPDVAAKITESSHEHTAVSVVKPEPEQPSASSAPRRSRTSPRSRLALSVERDEPLDNVTTRLRHSTNELLTDAALRQRLKKESPSTRQDIVEAALGDWFRKHGYGFDAKSD